MSVKQISVFLENKPGALYAMTGVLAQNKVDMRAFSLAETSDFGIARIIVSDIYAATTILREAGYVHSISEVLAVSVPDVPGGLNKVLQVLTDAGVNVEYMYVFPSSSKNAYMVFRVTDTDAAESALTARKINLVSQDAIERM
jgi:hypothetical protein